MKTTKTISTAKCTVHLTLTPVDSAHAEQLGPDIVRECSVVFEDGSRYRACFAPAIGACGETPYWDDNQLIIVSSIGDDSILKAIQHVIETGNIESAFEAVSSGDSVPSGLANEYAPQKPASEQSTNDSPTDVTVGRRRNSVMWLLWMSADIAHPSKEWLIDEIAKRCDLIWDTQENKFLGARTTNLANDEPSSPRNE